MYPALDKCVMSALLMCPSCPYHNDDTRISTRNKSPSLNVTDNGYNECTFGPQASMRFPLWSVHPLDEMTTRMPSSKTCQTLCSTSVEPPRRLSSIVPILIMAQCCEFPTRTE